MSGRFTSWIKKKIPVLKLKEIDYMSLNRLRLNLSCDSSLPVRTSYAQNTRARAAKLQKLLENTQISFDSPEIVINPYGLTPLTALIFFHTPEPCRVICTVKGHTAALDWQFRYNLPCTSHAVPVFGLYPDSDNLVELLLESPDGTKIKNGEFHILTDKLPLDSDVSADTSFPYISDCDGKIRYVLKLPVSSEKGHMLELSNQNFLFVDNEICTPAVESPLPTHLYEADLLGRVFRTYYIGSGVEALLGETPERTGFLVTTKNPDGTRTNVEIDYITGAATQPAANVTFFEQEGADFVFGVSINSIHKETFQKQKTGIFVMRALDAVPFSTTGWLHEPVPYKGASIQTASAVDRDYMEKNYHMHFSICGDTLLIRTTGNDIQEVVFSKSDRVYQLDLTSPLTACPDTRYTLAVPFTEMYSGTYSIIIRFRDGGQEVLADTITLSRTRKTM